MQLVQEGKLRLDDPADRYIPELRDLHGYSSQYRFTLRQLASHTSGLDRELILKGANTGPVDQWENKALACIPLTSFYGFPGSQFEYSNIGFALLGLALERAAGVPFTQLVQDRIFTPLHMDNTFFAVPDDKRHQLAHGIENRTAGQINTRLPMMQMEGMGYHVPSGGIWSTPSDLAKFLIALTQTDALLRPKSVREMLSVPLGGETMGLE
jgi:CubicO group peptidase (beta-lactamase class C family)